MSVDIVVGVLDPEERSRRQVLASRVIGLVDAPTPERRVLCLLDGVDCPHLKAQTGGVNRGVHFDDPGPEERQYVLDRLQELGEPESLTGYQTLVYLHGTTCSTDVGLGITLAHEFQHLKQSTGMRPEYVASRVIGKCDEVVRARGLIWSDVPHEREARIVSKRVAVTVFGAETVQTYIDRQITDGVSKMNAALIGIDKEPWSSDTADWLFIRRVDADLAYDLVQETRELYPTLRRFRNALEETRHDYPDLRSVDLGPLFSGEYL
jgi:hypothetical protein